MSKIKYSTTITTQSTTPSRRKSGSTRSRQAQPRGRKAGVETENKRGRKAGVESENKRSKRKHSFKQNVKQGVNTPKAREQMGY